LPGANRKLRKSEMAGLLASMRANPAAWANPP
jgi:hypothetical protein